MDVCNDAGGGGEGAPEEEGPEDDPAGAASGGVNAGDLEQEIAEKEEGAEPVGLIVGNREVLLHSAGHAEPEVGSIEVGEAIGDEDDWEQSPPAGGGEDGLFCQGIKIRKNRAAREWVGKRGAGER